jgi:hypothetical protein
MDEKIAAFKSQLDSFSASIEECNLLIQQAEQKASSLKDTLSGISFSKRQLEVDLEDLIVVTNKEKEKTIRLDRIKYLTDIVDAEIESNTEKSALRRQLSIKIECLRELFKLGAISNEEYLLRMDKIKSMYNLP